MKENRSKKAAFIVIAVLIAFAAVFFVMTLRDTETALQNEEKAAMKEIGHLEQSLFSSSLPGDRAEFHSKPLHYAVRPVLPGDRPSARKTATAQETETLENGHTPLSAPEDAEAEAEGGDESAPAAGAMSTESEAEKEEEAEKEKAKEEEKEKEKAKEKEKEEKEEAKKEETAEAEKESQADEEKNEEEVKTEEETEADEDKEPEAESEEEPEAQTEPGASQTMSVEEGEDETEQEELTEEEEEEEPDVSEYGTATGNWGYGNQQKNVIWTEYVKDGVYTIVVSVVDKSLGGEANAIIRLLDQDGKKDTGVKSTLQGRVTNVVFRKGVTGIGWTYLNTANTNNAYDPSWPNDASDPSVTYKVDSSKTDVFNGFTKLKTVVPCSTIERIGWAAFRKCNSLNDFDFSKCRHLKEILNQAFNPCPALNHIDLSACNELKAMGWATFSGCGTGKSVSLKLPAHGKLAIIGGNAFNSFGKSAPAITVDFSGVTSLQQIHRYAFQGTHIAGDLSCLNSLDLIGTQAFVNTNITGIQISSDIPKIPSDAFKGCGSLQKIIWNPSAYSDNMAGSEFASSSGYELVIGGSVTKLTKNFFKTVYSAGDVYFEGVSGGHVIHFLSGAATGGAEPFSSITHSCYVDERGVVYELTGEDTARVAYCPPGIQNYTVSAQIRTPAAEHSSAATYNVTGIAPAAFIKARDLKTVSFADASIIRSVGEKAFYGVGTLEKVVDLRTDTEAVTVIGAMTLFTGVGDEDPVPGNAFEGTGLGNSIAVYYRVKAAKIPNGTKLDGKLPGTIGDAVIADIADDTVLTVDDLRSHYYRTTKGSRALHFPYFTYMFRGWQTESGTLVYPGDQILPNEKDANGNSIFDKNGDGRIELVSDWVGTWKPNSGSTGTPSANFSIWTNVSSANSSIDADAFLPEQVVNYSPKISNAIIYAEDENGIVYPDQLISPASGGKKFNMIHYVGSSILEADQNVRQLADTGFTATDPKNGAVHWKLSYLPDDEEVLGGLAEMTEKGEVVMKDENGDTIPADQLNTEHYVVRWCCVKYQSGDSDGWNINAKLTRKLSYVSVTKTFSGDAEAAAEAISPKESGKIPFNITLTSESDPEKVITLRMVNRAAGKGGLTPAAIANGKLSQENQYGYVQVIHDAEAGTDRYVWIVAFEGEDTFFVKENDYNVTLGGIPYGVIAQYNQINTGNARDKEVRQWTNRSLITTQPQPTDDVDTSRFETTNFYNEYVAKDTFIIENYDGEGVIMPNTEFSVYDENGRRLKLNAAGSSSSNRRYSVLLDEGQSSDTALTGSDGIIRLTLPKRTDRAHVYTIRQQIPEGYIGAGETDSFQVTVDADGAFSIDKVTGPEGFGSVTALQGDAGNTYGAKVVNQSRLMDIVVTKSWSDNIEPENHVKLTLTRTFKNTKGSGEKDAQAESTPVKTFTITKEENWEKRFPDMPIMSGNRLLSYSLEEDCIGDDAKETAAYEDWEQVLSVDDTNPDELILNLKNEHADDIAVTLHKKDSSTGEPVKDVVFRVYKKTNGTSGSTKTNFKGVTYRTSEPVDVVTSAEGLAELMLRTNHVYYVEEFAAPLEYKKLGVFMELSVDGEGKVTLVRDVENSELVVSNSDNRYITVLNERHNSPAPTNYDSPTMPYIFIALLAIFLLAVGFLAHRHYVRKERA